MEENVALDTTKQKKFVKSIKGIKKLIKKSEAEKSEEAVSPKPKNDKPKHKRPERGLVYLSHIPHGFYEHEMTQYFKQFGMVTNVRVIRSKRTGNSKGYAFVEFKEPAVGQIVAETMNNYLMGKRLIKAAYIPPEKQRPKAMRKHWSRMNNPGRDNRMKMKKAYNANKDEAGDLKRAKKMLSNINKTKKKLSELGINYDFFTPVDVPEVLQDFLKAKENKETNIKESTVISEKQSKKNKQAQNEESIKDAKEPMKKVKPVVNESQDKPAKNKKPIKTEVKKESIIKINKEAEQSKKDAKKSKQLQETVVNKKEQKQKQQKLKDGGINLPENFIKVQEESGDSDSSLDFDSDEYDKMLEDDSGDDSEVDEGGDGDNSEASEDEDSNEDDNSSDEDEEDIFPPPKKTKGKAAAIVTVPPKQVKKQKGQATEQVKRKAPQKPAVTAKKPKFEKQTQQPLKKQFKKKK